MFVEPCFRQHYEETDGSIVPPLIVARKNKLSALNNDYETILVVQDDEIITRTSSVRMYKIINQVLTNFILETKYIKLVSHSSQLNNFFAIFHKNIFPKNKTAE